MSGSRFSNFSFFDCWSIIEQSLLLTVMWNLIKCNDAARWNSLSSCFADFKSHRIKYRQCKFCWEEINMKLCIIFHLSCLQKCLQVYFPNHCCPDLLIGPKDECRHPILYPFDIVFVVLFCTSSLATSTFAVPWNNFSSSATARMSNKCKVHDCHITFILYVTDASLSTRYLSSKMWEIVEL